MAVQHTFNYLKNTSNGVEERTDKRYLTRSAAIKFYCLDCAGGLTTEVKKCELTTCPLWVFRPYQK